MVAMSATRPAPRRCPPMTSRPRQTCQRAPMPLIAAVVGLSIALIVGVCAWVFAPHAADSGPEVAVRTAAGLWVLAHHVPIELPTGPLSLTPLGLMLIPALLLYVAGRQVARVAKPRRPADLVRFLLPMSLTYALITAIVAGVAAPPAGSFSCVGRVRDWVCFCRCSRASGMARASGLARSSGRCFPWGLVSRCSAASLARHGAAGIRCGHHHDGALGGIPRGGRACFAPLSLTRSAARSWLCLSVLCAQPGDLVDGVQHRYWFRPGGVRGGLTARRRLRRVASVSAVDGDPAGRRAWGARGDLTGCPLVAGCPHRVLSSTVACLSTQSAARWRRWPV